MSTLMQRATTGVKWTAISQFGRQGLGILATAILARLLAPSDYGLMGMVLVVTGFASIFKDLGTSAAVVQRKDVTPGLLSSIFWANVGFGVVMSLIVLALSPLVGSYFKSPRVVSLLWAIAPIFPIAGVTVVQQAIFQREMKFNVLAYIEMASAIIGAAVGIGGALLGLGVWSLVLQSLATTTTTTAGLWAAGPWKPSMTLRFEDLRRIMPFSGYLTLYSTFNYFARNIDNILIGRYLGPEILGYYSLAYRIMQYPLQSISGLYGKVLLPAFARLQDNNPAFGAAYLRTLGYIAIVTFPLMVGFGVLAEPIIALFLSAKWLTIVPVVRILCIVGLNQSLSTTVGNIYIAKGRTRQMFWVGTISSAVYVFSIVVGLRWGMIGVAVAYAIADLLLTPPNYYLPFKLIGLPSIKVLYGIVRPLLCSVAMGWIVWSLSPFVLHMMGEAVGLTTLVGLGMLSYYLLSLALNRVQAMEFYRVARGLP